MRFNSTAQYRKLLYSWDSIIRIKAQEFAGYILGKRSQLDFANPNPTLPRDDIETIKNRILSMSSVDAGKLGIGRSTLWYLQTRSRSGKPLRYYTKIRTKLFS